MKIKLEYETLQTEALELQWSLLRRWKCPDCSADSFFLSPALCLGMKQTLSSPCEKSWSRECVLAEPD